MSEAESGSNLPEKMMELGFGALAPNNVVLPDSLVKQLSFNPYYVPIMRLLQSSSDIVSAGETPEAKPGAVMFGQDEFLQTPFEVVPVAQRIRAVIWEKGEVARNIYDVNDPEYVVCLNHKGKEKQGGIEVLFWIPEIEKAGRFMFANTALKNVNGFKNGQLQLFDSKRVKGETWYFVPLAKLHNEVRVEHGPERAKLANSLAKSRPQPNWAIFVETIAKFKSCDPKEDMKGQFKDKGTDLEEPEEEVIDLTKGKKPKSKSVKKAR